jgi:hypothetical protein
MSEPALPGDRSLWERFERAEGEIRWEELPAPRTRRKAAAPPVRRRLAKLHDEEARLEEEERPGGRTVLAASGPVGALLILLAMQRHGLPQRLRGRNGGEIREFPDGAIEAVWEEGTTSAKPLELPIEDLLVLARYAL